jgi:hypothetical protein
MRWEAGCDRERAVVTGPPRGIGRVMSDQPEEVTSRPLDAASLDAGLDGRDVYWFVGGPLDGRVHTRAPDDPAPPVVRHTHLHDGPKIVHLYDLHEVAGHGGEYRLRER